tara:strand:- start:1184 stop:2095 length:912 start_codon:yes stop_codon:yes gene_type:complete
MKKKIIILSGGYSKEKEVSKDTGKEVFNVLKKKYNVKLLDPKGDLVKKLKKYKPDVVFNALHGRFGEDGYIQSILEFLKIKYTHSGIISSLKAIDKEISKKIFKKNKILTPKSFTYAFDKKKDYLLKKIKKKLKFPVVIKPLNEGSSVGVHICNHKNLWFNIKKLREYPEILIESYIPGKEIQSAILGNNKLGSIELVPKRKFYDYKAKYQKNAKTKHIMPANISKYHYNLVNNIAYKAHKLLKCRGVSRSDFRFYNNKFYLLEINTQPGMTSLSLVPEIARYNNINFEELLDFLIKDASIKK